MNAFKPQEEPTQKKESIKFVDKDGEKEIQLRELKKQKVVPVQNFGIGILLDKQEKLQRLAEQVDSSCSRDLFLAKTLKTLDIPEVQSQEEFADLNYKKAVKEDGSQGDYLQNILSAWAKNLSLLNLKTVQKVPSDLPRDSEEGRELRAFLK